MDLLRWILHRPDSPLSLPWRSRYLLPILSYQQYLSYSSTSSSVSPTHEPQCPGTCTHCAVPSTNSTLVLRVGASRIYGLRLENLQLCSVRDPAKIISYIQVQLFVFFPTSPIQLKLGTASRWETTNSSPLDQSNYQANQQQVLSFVVLFPSLHILLCKNAGPKPFCWAKPTCFDSASSDFLFCSATYWAPLELLLGLWLQNLGIPPLKWKTCM